MKLYSSGFSHHDTTEIDMIYGGVFDPNNEGWMSNRAGLDEWCSRHTDASIVCIDAEKQWWVNLRERHGIEQHLKLFHAVKTHLPMARVGFFGLPLKEWHQDTTWIDEAAFVMPIIEEVDVLFPVIYDHDNKDEAADHDRAARSVRLCTMLHESVIPFSHHRYTPSNQSIGLTLIPHKEHINQMKSAIMPGVSGLHAWNEDAWYLKKVRQGYTGIDSRWPAVFENEILDGESDTAYHGRINEMIIDRMRKVK